MSKRFSIVAEPREVIGKKVKQLRRNGMVPAVIYGQTDPVSVQLEARELRRVLRGAGRTALIDVAVGSETRTVLARDIQKHVTRGSLIHVDFYEVDLTQAVKVSARVVRVNQLSTELRSLGMSSLVLPTIEIECLPDALVSEVYADLNLIKKMSDMILVKDLTIPEGVTVNADPRTTAVTFAVNRRALAEVDADGVEIVAEAEPAA